jgi:hypothetical protein
MIEKLHGKTWLLHGDEADIFARRLLSIREVEVRRVFGPVLQNLASDELDSNVERKQRPNPGAAGFASAVFLYGDASLLKDDAVAPHLRDALAWLVSSNGNAFVDRFNETDLNTLPADPHQRRKLFKALLAPSHG